MHRAEDVLAAVAARVGAPWDGPGDPRGVAVDVILDRPPWEVLDAAREALVAADPEARRRLGAHHTPPALAAKLAALVVGDATSTVADPACGGGAFLVAAGEALVRRGANRRRVVEEQLLGADIDPLAAATSRAALSLWSGGARAAGIDVADGLEWRPPAPVDVVVGNPPFRSPLAAGARRGGLAPYTDLAGRFLVAALDLVRDDGRVLMLQPESVLAARDARPVRGAGALDGLWFDDERVFAADVRVCALLLRRSTHQPPVVARWVGADVSATSAAELEPAAPTWAHLRPDAPAADTSRGTSTIGDIATATAGFRQHFYGVAAATREGGDGPPVVTSGLIDPGRLLWGERTARIAGRHYHRPTVDLDALPPAIAGWVEARRTPKVLVATQTRAIEAAADHAGVTVPLTPVIAVHPHDAGDVDRIVDTLSGDRATAWARRHYAGTALGRGAIKLSARQVLEVALV